MRNGNGMRRPMSMSTVAAADADVPAHPRVARVSASVVRRIELRMQLRGSRADVQMGWE